MNIISACSLWRVSGNPRDLHNLLGDTNVVSIRISEDGSYQFVREIRGDSVADILDYVEYDPRRILEDLREAAERAVREKRITPSERYKILANL